MNRLNSIALLAGGALVAVAATGCSSNAAKPTASGPVAATSAASGAPSTATSSTQGGASNSAPAGGSTSAAAGGSTSAPDHTAPSSNSVGGDGGPDGGSTTAPAAPPVSHPVCANADVNVALAPAVSGQKSSVFVIAVKNAGSTCTLGPIPYVWITKSPTDASDQTRPLIPDVDTGKKNVILSGTTLYAAIDLLPGALATTTGTYGDLAVTANPTPDTSGKDVQDVQLPAASAEGGAKLGVYALTPAAAIDQIQYATTPEK